MIKSVSVAIAAAAMMAAGSASAVTITFNDTFGPQPTEIVNETLSVSLFDDMGGTRTLTSVSVFALGSVDADGTVTNNNPGPTTFRVSEVVDQFEGTVASGPASLQNLEVFPTFGGTLIGAVTYNDLAAGQSAAFGPFAEDDIASFTITDPVELADFVGAGTFSYTFNTLIGVAISGGGGNIATNINTNATGTLRVVYEFDEIAAVPAPAGIALFALGLLGMRRLRK